ncbi:MAG: glycosyltransferase [Phycisphaerae bacterium]|nr:glycosyltransferase [Phycisphaerae bacterium]MDW8261484.1 glycosyltransferase [Phycisphaerales bacterium]
MERSAAVIITTKNRKEELRKALQSCFSQTVAAEVLVIDDGSTDGTADMVRAEFPAARVDRSERSLGLIGQRTRAAGLTSAEIIFSIDDDAAFISPQTIEQTLAEFSHPRVAAVAIPYLEPHKPATKPVRPPPDGRIYCTSHYIGCAHAIRRDVFLSLGGYRDVLFRQGEEVDLGMRLLRAGYVVRVGAADPLEHYESPRRDNRLQFYYTGRNALLVEFWNVPMPRLLWRLASNHVNLITFAIRRRHPWWMIRGILGGWVAMYQHRQFREPMTAALHRLQRRLVKERVVLLEEIEPLLPPLSPLPGQG